MQRYYINGFIPKKNIQITEAEILHHCYKVLRLQSEDFICIFNWTEYFDYVYKIIDITKNSITLIQEKVITKIPKKTHISLYQALPNKLSKLEYIVQKNTEIGLEKIIIFQADYSQNSVVLTDKKITRLKKIGIEACEQSNNNIIPTIEIVNQIDFHKIKEQRNIFLHSGDSQGWNLNDISSDKNWDIMNIFIGPEWWFSKTEIEQFSSHKCKQLYLWESILRTETAWLVTWFYLLQNF